MKPLIKTFILALVILNPISLQLTLNGDRQSSVAQALPPPEDIPEEILRTEIILEGRSPIDGKPLSAREYEELTAELAQSTNNPKVNSNVRELIFLLQLRKFLKTVIPFY